MYFLCFLLSVLFVSPLAAMTKEASARLCETNITRLEESKSSLPGNAQEAFSFILLQLRDSLDKLKNAAKFDDIHTHRSSCDRGYQAALWVMERSGGKIKDEVNIKSANEVKMNGNAEQKGSEEGKAEAKSGAEKSDADKESKAASPPAQSVSLKKKPGKSRKTPLNRVAKVSQKIEKKKSNEQNIKTPPTPA
jgi:hypothetical protein